MRPLGDQLFSFTKAPGQSRSGPRTRDRINAKQAGLPESWFRDAIFDEPELVIGACRAAELTDDEWRSLQTEFRTDAGPIDVLLVSSSGQLAIVETKLATNPENRRKVLAQALDYLAHLPECTDEIIRLVPKDENGDPFADPDDVAEAIGQGDVLVIIASDEVDPRVAKLSKTLLATNSIKQWNLALIDLAIYRDSERSEHELLVVPVVRHVVEREQRQVVRVIVQGEDPSARVEVETVTFDDESPSRQQWNEQQYFESLAEWGALPEVRRLAHDLRDLAARYPEAVTLSWGTGKKSTMVLKRNGGGLIELRSTGKIRFRPSKFERALGEPGAKTYLETLKALAPTAMSMRYPIIRGDEAARIAPKVFEALLQAIEKAEAAQSDIVE